MEREESDEESLSDDDWAAIRAVLPSFAAEWLAITQDSSYDATLPFISIHELAKHIVEKVIREHPEDMESLADALEYEFTIASLRGREDYVGLLRVGLLEGLIEAADDVGMPLTRIVPLLRGTRIRAQWSAAIAWKRQGRVWDDIRGAVPTFDLPSPVGTIEIHRGRRIDERRVLLDARLVGGDPSKARFVRQEAGKDFWIESRILSVIRRSNDLPDEYEFEIESQVRDGVDQWEYNLPPMSEPFWQLADGSSTPPREPPNDDL
jgi:hypothetical protein